MARGGNRMTPQVEGGGHGGGGSYGSCPRCALALRTPNTIDVEERYAVLGEPLRVRDTKCARCGMLLMRTEAR